MNKLITLTTSPDELLTMISMIRKLYFGRSVEGLSIIWSEAEWDLGVNPFVQRYYSEYSQTERPAKIDDEWIDAAIRRIILEEKPDVLVVPNGADHYEKAVQFAKERGAKTLACPMENFTNLRNLEVDAFGVLEKHEMERVHPKALSFRDFETLLPWLTKTESIEIPRDSGGITRESLAEKHWDSLMERLPDGPILFEKRKLGPAGEPVAALRLFELASATKPAELIREALNQVPEAYFIETINFPLDSNDRTFRYREYDNEFASAAADFDLYELCSGLEGLHFQAELLERETGCASGDGPAEAPNGPRLIIVRVSRTALIQPEWWEKYQLPADKKLNIVLADSMNMAGSLANHCLTINRYTQHSAVGICTTEHPWISYPDEECQLKYINENPSADVIKALENADGFIFFEDDDETSSTWPIDLKPYVYGKPVVHVYIGYRIHKKVAAMQRPGRTILTPLPHLQRMIPGAHFYAGFPPASLYDMPMAPPQSAKDGILRVLQTPSMPDKGLSRFVYHKDTESYLAATRKLKKKHPKVEFLQLGGLPHSQILRARQLCDITLNHLRGYISLSGDEALYFKRPLVQAFDRFSINRHKEYWGLDTPFPWLTATPHTLADVFDRLLADSQLRKEVGEAGHQFIEKYFAPKLGILPLVWHLAHASEAQE